MGKKRVTLDPGLRVDRRIDKKGGDPAYPPEWVPSPSGMVPNITSQQRELNGIEAGRIAREEAERKSVPRYDREHMTYAELDWLERTGGWEH